MGLLLPWCAIFFLVLCGGRQLAIGGGESKNSYLTSKGKHSNISGDQVLISPSGNFALGFFIPKAINGDNVASTIADVAHYSTTSKRHYLGIWFNDISEKTVLWVANRENPIVTTTSNNHFGIFKIIDDGNIAVFDGDRGVLLWSSNVTGSSENTTAKLLDTGNLVLARGANDGIVWQSFEHPTDTMIQGMRLRFNLKTGVGWRLYAWRIPGKDPAPGPVSAGFDPKSPLQIVLWNGTEILWRFGMRNNKTTNAIKITNTSLARLESIVKNDVEVCYTFGATEQLSTMRRSLDVMHGLTDHLLESNTKNWTAFYRIPSLPCDTYDPCGPFGTCNASANPPCKCLQGFRPKNRSQWNAGNLTGGCVRQVELVGCGGRFVKFTKMRLPDNVTLLTNRSAWQCGAECWRSSGYTAFAYANMAQVPVKDLRCLLWYGVELRDLLHNVYVGGDLYVCIVASSKYSVKRVLLVFLLVISVSIVLNIAFIYFWRRRIGRCLTTEDGREIIIDTENSGDVTMPPLLKYSCILTATDNFSQKNKLGKGGFGSVYKGKLLDGQEIAVKRLSKGSGRGFQEFKNKIELIGKLQHTNLVRLLGWSAHDDERILIYEYLPNKSLDKIIYDTSSSATLNWRQRYCIIEGIAQGILYLHRYPRVRIIHRDLKPSNILLDHAMNPKISDFDCLGRIFGGNKSEAATKIVLGTYGYMPPEYATAGLFSEKTDVFSFGVIVLEIITGKRSISFYRYQESMTLLEYVWQVWKEGRVLDLIDASMTSSSSIPTEDIAEDIARCVQIGLLCVEEHAMDRPTMTSVISFLANNNASSLPTPKKPAFAINSQPDLTPSVASWIEAIDSSNDLSITSFGQE